MVFIDFLKENINDIKKLFLNSFINKILEVSKNDYVLYFSKNKDYGILLSINNDEPFVKVIHEKFNFSLQSNFLNKLKSRLMNSYLIDVSLANEDNIVSFDFIKTTDTYDKFKYKLMVETFKANSNLLILEENKIIEAFRYRSLDTKRPILNGLTYNFPNKITIYKEFSNKDLERINLYISNIYGNYLKSKYSTVISSLKRKRKTIFNKIKKLNEEKSLATNFAQYKEYGDYILENQNNVNKGEKNFFYNNINIPLREDLTPIENAQHYYKLYKKAKTSLKILDDYISSSLEELNYIDSILNSYEFYNEDDYIELIDDLNKRNIIKIRLKIIPKINKNTSKPYYFLVNNTKIGFGKNNKQNNYLTFKEASKNCYFIHIKDYSGAHVIIFSPTPTNEEIKIALELSLTLSNKTDGDVICTNIKNVKKTSSLGKVNLLNYETYHISHIKHDIKQLIKNSNRF